MNTVLVTGYGGFLGEQITKQLLKRGYSVRGLARGTYPHLAAQGVDCRQGSITSKEDIHAALPGCDAIVHTAAKAGVWGPYTDYYTANTLATQHLIDAALNNNVRAFVHTSSPSVTFAGEHQTNVDETVGYPDHWLCAYPKTKALAEQLVLETALKTDLRACALRPHLIWGPGDPHLFPRVVERARSRKLKRVGQGTNLIDVVHVKHAAWAHVRALELLQQDSSINGEAFFLSDGEPIECWKWISMILDHAGVEIPKASISYKTAYRIGGALEWTYRCIGKKSEPPMTRFVAAQLALDHYFNIDKARKLLAYNPQLDRSQELAKCFS